MTTDPEAVLAAADELYALPLSDFTPARDARVKELKGTDLAAPVKALRKPSLAAWVVNLLARRESGQVEQVLAVGAALREAQDSMSADDLRELTRQRRQLTAAVAQQARSLAHEAGVRVTPAVADQVEATLTAGILDPACGQAVRSGLLVTALAATGVDAVDVASAVALPEALGFAATPREVASVEEEAPSRPALHVVPDADAEEKARDAAREAVGEAEDAAEQAREAREDAASEAEQLEARTLQKQAEIDEVRRRLADLEEEAEELDDELSDAEQVRAEADDALRAAESELEQARAALDRLG